MSMEKFHVAVNAIFADWTALQLAVQQGAAGPQSADIAKWMVDAVVQWFSENKNLQPFEVEDFLDRIVDQEFNLVIDDGSVIEISGMICEFYALAASKDRQDELERRMQALPKCDLSKCRIEEPSEQQPVPEQSPNDDSMEVEDEDPPVDPDGWTVVSRKKK